MRSKKFFSILIILFMSLFFFVTSSFAQTTANTSTQTDAEAGTLGVAHLFEIKGKNIKDGSIISSSEKGNVLTQVAYDSQVVGVVSRDAAIIINTSNIPNGIPVISSGTVYVLVSTKNGPIKKGDLLTTSTIPGVAVKALKDGYVLGTALEDYNNPNASKIGEVALNLNLYYFNTKPTFTGTLSDIFKIALLPTKNSPTPIFKYTVAAMVVLGSFVLAFLSFGRTAAKGVEALGRNPAASKIIHLGIIFNVFIVAIIVMAGLTVAFLILRL
jgi:F0F1-type ATP synthase membrane subunit c/vacuolar-type H+-ATPase subunit K